MGLFCVVLLGSSRVAQTQEFSRAQPGYVWSFPRDHGSHPLYQTEWWYYTGQLYAPGKEPFRDAPEYGFQLTFFRRSEGSGDATHSEYMAHAALTDIAGGRTYFSSRRGGGALGLATTSNDSLGARSGDWTVDPIGGHLVLRFTVDSATSLGAKPLEVRILTAELPPAWLQGENGFSKKAICDSCASMYYSLPRIGLQGRVVVGEGSRDLQGLAWMDHEFMTSSLGEKQVGWDWFGLMLKDGRSIMLFQLRNVVGGIDFVSGAVQRGGAIRALTKGEFSVLPIRSWRSPVSGAQYPIEWRVSIPAEGIDTVVRARVSGCEVGDPPQSGSADSGSVQYWEGPVASADESVTGYLEMTGYAGKIAPF
jgi:predicted secreted hydrolase